MGKKIPRITNSEMQILEVLWDEGEALTSSEIVEVSDDRTWKSSSVHLLLNSLLKKNFVQVAGFKKTTKNYARTFKPKMSKSEYVLQQAENKCGYEELVKAIAAKVNSIDELYRLIDILADRKKEIG